MKPHRKKTGWRIMVLCTAVIVFAIPVLIGGGLLLFRGLRQIAIRKDAKIEDSKGVEIMERVRLGGLDQWILIRGKDRSKPVLLWLHGGPGSPTMPMASLHDTELVEGFVVVHWDQRGAGKSYSPDIPKSSMTADRFVSDTYELTRYLKNQFDVPKIYLMGHSWGSQIGMLTVSRHPEEYYAFIALGQFVYAPEADALGYRFALNQAEQKRSARALKKLKALGSPPWTTEEQRAVSARWINTFGGTGIKFTSGDYLCDMATSPDYTIRDMFAYIRGMRFSGSTMLVNDELNRINLFELVREVEIPVYFFQGRFDSNTPGAIVEAYFEMLEAPKKMLVWFEQSAHFLQWEEPLKISDELKKILDETGGL